ncbi:hypothetical protein ISN45_Aa06g005900 [Arabidopsis thaliana x Arabidopsis arenosa]|uniref:Uncharacterized protein n=1 Tax=Arabidopsis thaliana x Arabidopsis arenosa TaxID=1240361 RepID=A0A8T1YUD5_9BRAS|nr:hypothetical protein ISN45_Aa06g005900 [Arabidopsis thaliana x Arabidopsis arenosa]
MLKDRVDRLTNFSIPSGISKDNELFGRSNVSSFVNCDTDNGLEPLNMFGLNVSVCSLARLPCNTIKFLSSLMSPLNVPPITFLLKSKR